VPALPFIGMLVWHDAVVSVMLSVTPTA